MSALYFVTYNIQKIKFDEAEKQFKAPAPVMVFNFENFLDIFDFRALKYAVPSAWDTPLYSFPISFFTLLIPSQTSSLRCLFSHNKLYTDFSFYRNILQKASFHFISLISYSQGVCVCVCTSFYNPYHFLRSIRKKTTSIC